MSTTTIPTEELVAVFTTEEVEIAMKMLADGQLEHIASVIEIDSPTKEHAIQVILDSIRIPVNPEGSAVRREMEMRLAKGEEIITSPEDEKMWQAKLDAEARGEVVEIDMPDTTPRKRSSKKH